MISTATVNKGLVGALYVESPYVDVLRTISNPSLPLTLLETKEFGIGTNPTDILATSEWSPMEHIPDDGLDLFVVARSDKADLEVYPYEVMKWITRVRGVGDEKLLYVHNGQGHFTTNIESRAEDLALLENWLTGPRINNLGDKYKMNRTMMGGRNRKNRNATRKNRSNRRNRNNAPANATMLGGRRSRRNRDRKNRSRKNRRN